ncbi:MAG: Ig-like domain-containing protein [Planctomycetota bacterium]
MRTIVVTNQKGGCGKTTTAVNLAAALAQKGQRVLIVDLDPQAHATLGMGYNPETLDKTIYHSLANQQIPISRVIVSTNNEGLDLVPSNVLLSKAEIELTTVSRKEFILAEQLKTVSDEYDICVIDCPPSLGLLTFNALVASTDIIVPVQVHYYALEGLKQLLETVKTARKRFYPCSVKILGILLTFVEGKAALSQQVEQQMREFFGDLVFDTVIHRTITLAEAPSAGETISTYAPESKGAAEYSALAEEVTDPEYKKKKKRLPKEVSTVVKDVRRAEKAGVLQPAVETKTTERPPRHFFGLKAVKSRFDFLSILAILLVIVFVSLMIVVSLINSPPVARPKSITTQEDTPVPITLMASDRDSDQLTYHVLTGPSNGALSGTAPGVTYTPTLDYNGTDSFIFIVNDGTVDSNTVTVSITVEAVNDDPIANPQSAVTKEDRAVSITLTGSDVDSETLNFATCTQPGQGKITFGSNFSTSGNLIYTPKKDFTGTDSFTFKLNDGTADSAPAMVSINITPNRSPVAELQSVTVAEDMPGVITLTGNDPDTGDTLVYSVVTDPSHGKLSGTAPDLTYTPSLNFRGPDSFTFRVHDGKADSTPATVSITVSPVNDLPVANSDSATMLEDTPASITLTGIDPDGDSLTYSVVKVPSNGSLSGTEPNLTYTPNDNFYGEDSFTFKANDGTADSVVATVSLTVTPVDDPPIATPLPKGKSVMAQEDKSTLITLEGSDPDGDRLTYSVVRAPSNGNLTGTAPNLTYTPDPNFDWLDSFTFKVNDGTTDSVPATVFITVTQVPDPPKANDDKATTKEDTPVEIDVLVNDSDVDNELLRVSAVSHGISGSVTINADNTVTYTPNMNFYGTDSFTYTVSDRLETDTAKVNVTVSMVNDAPVIVSKPVTTAMVGVLYTYDVNATDPDVGDALTYSLIGKPSGMTIAPTTGLIQWTPIDAHEKINDVIVKVVDSNLTPDSGTQSFSISVKPTPPKMAKLNIVDGYNRRKQSLSATGKIAAVKKRDDDRLEITSGSYISYDFENVTVPPGATITSVVVYVEHFEEQKFYPGKLQWNVGTGWPTNPSVWISMNAPVRKGEQNEMLDSWDVTSFVNTHEKVNSFQLQVKNDDSIAKGKTFVNHIYAVVKWDWPVPPIERIISEPEQVEYELVPIR